MAHSTTSNSNSSSDTTADFTSTLSDSTPSSTHSEEQAYLVEVKWRLRRALQEARERLQHYSRDVEEQKTYLWESRDEMDHIEKIAARETIEQTVKTGEAVVAQRERLHKLERSLYFGRFDFARSGEQAKPVYIGIHHFHDEFDKKNLVYDWRAPIASLFYDYETGPAQFEAPEGEIKGNIELKRQFRIKNGEIELMIDSAVNVVDDVLQDELSRASDEGMKNIVATIQRDQNAIIRNDEAPVLIIQGVAGSGKTSIALHRIAFLLYRFKDTLSSEDILIISPNRVFADYIANVLPELGEETVNEMRMEDLADQLLEGEFRFQSFFEQTSALLEKDDPAMRRRIQFKSSPDLLRKLDRYAAHADKSRFVAEDIWIAKRLVPAWLLEEIFNKHSSLGPSERIKQLVTETEQKIGIQYHYDLTPEDRQQLRGDIRKMSRQTSLRKTYRQFYDWLGDAELFKTGKHSQLEYADVFPLIYLKMKLERKLSPYRKVKHLLVDEMQDYTPVQYAVLNKLFNCRKTILGDARQSINPFTASHVGEIQQALKGASVTTLNTSYRSSYQISQFTLRISPNPELVAIQRHGEEPQVIHCKSQREEMSRLAEMAQAFLHSEHNSLAIICKTNKQARQSHDALTKAGVEAQLLNELSTSFGSGIVVCTAHLAKGLEFDRVLVPFAKDTNYQSEMDRNLLYVACTRAMHRLTLTHSGPITSLLQSPC